MIQLCRSDLLFRSLDVYRSGARAVRVFCALANRPPSLTVRRAEGEQQHQRHANQRPVLGRAEQGATLTSLDPPWLRCASTCSVTDPYRLSFHLTTPRRRPPPRDGNRRFTECLCVTAADIPRQLLLGEGQRCRDQRGAEWPQ